MLYFCTFGLSQLLDTIAWDLHIWDLLIQRRLAWKTHSPDLTRTRQRWPTFEPNFASNGLFSGNLLMQYSSSSKCSKLYSKLISPSVSCVSSYYSLVCWMEMTDIHLQRSSTRRLLQIDSKISSVGLCKSIFGSNYNLSQFHLVDPTANGDCARPHSAPNTHEHCPIRGRLINWIKTKTKQLVQKILI